MRQNRADSDCASKSDELAFFLDSRQICGVVAFDVFQIVVYGGNPLFVFAVGKGIGDIRIFFDCIADVVAHVYKFHGSVGIFD